MSNSVDVIIAGGGLAGLGLAYQLKKASPDISITVLEKQSFPRPRAVAKVGESTVEIGSHYLSKHLDLESCLRHEHLKKFGIRIFFGEPAADFSEQDELGASNTFGIPTYQIDRGDIENTLYQRVCALGVQVLDNVDIHSIDIQKKSHTVCYSKDGNDFEISASWLLDASGRAALVKKKLNLAEKNNHKANAVWFRIDRRIEIDEWSDNEDWQARCELQGRRWLSTNHLVGPGYWVWIIPLASGVTSIGIVMDDKALEDSAIVDQESAMRWLHENQTRCAVAIEGAKFLDFVVLRDYSYGCKKMMSSDGWALTGEAGLFADPFYSPGSDFIAISNTLIVDLVASDLRGEDIQFKALLFEKVFKSIYSNTLSLYVDQYGGFGDRQMMGLKLLWDYSYYWGVLSLLFFRDAITDLSLMRSMNKDLQRAAELNMQVQNQFRERAKQRLVLRNRQSFMDQFEIPCLQYFNQVLMDDSNVVEALNKNLEKIEVIANSVLDMLSSAPGLQISADEALVLGKYRHKVLLD